MRYAAVVLAVALVATGTLAVSRVAGPACDGGRVVLSEVAWEPAPFVELRNTGGVPASLAGWRLLGDVRHLFDRDVVVPPCDTLVLRPPRDCAAAGTGTVAWGRGGLRKKGGWLTLEDRAHRVVDHVRWPRRRDDVTLSLQRVPWTTAWTWAARTPGAPPRDPATSPRLVLDGARFDPPSPGRPAAVSVRVRSERPARVRARFASRRASGDVALSPAEREGGAVWYRGEVPALPDQLLVRLSFVAEDGGATAERSQDDDGRPLERFVSNPIDTKLPVYCLDVPEGRLEDLLTNPERERFPATLVILEGGRPTFQGDVTIQVRGGTWTRSWVKKNWVVNFPPRAHPRGLRQVNLRCEWHDPTSLRELLALELFHAAGVPAPVARHVRVTVGGAAAGLFLEVEMVDRRFLARNGLPDAALYQPVVARDQTGPERCDARAYAARSGYEAHWTKRTRRQEPYDDLAAFVDGFHACAGPGELQEFFARHLEVERYVSYLAVSAFVSHWDSMVKNQYWCHDDARSGRWTIIPWDLDRTWGDHFESPGYCVAPLLEGTRAQPVDPGGRNWWNWLQDRFLAVPEHRRRVLERILELARDFPATRLDAEIDGRLADLRAEILLDRARWGRYAHGKDPDAYVSAPFTEADLSSGVTVLKGFVHGRLTMLRRDCASELQRLPRPRLPEPSPPAPREKAKVEGRWVLLLPLLVLGYLASGYGTEERL